VAPSSSLTELTDDTTAAKTAVMTGRTGEKTAEIVAEGVPPSKCR
jgi:hypothetical protein